jgi:formate dehydrogenase gamma subunit
MRYSMMIDLATCVGCRACVSACKEQWDSGPGAARDWVHTYETGTRGRDLAVTFYPGLCMQCAEHPCTTDCPTGATFMNAQGVVVVDPNVCIGCGNCISNCPYGARHFDPDKGIVEKCNLCQPFVARGEQPACVATCLAECRVFGDLDDPASTIARLVREKNARPLTTAAVDVKPKVTYAGDRQREVILAQGVVTPPRPSWLTRAWGVTRPLARTAVPAVAAATIGAGLLVNLVSRRRRSPPHDHGAAPPAGLPAELPRHRAGMRFLHWFNAASWLLLLLTGTALMSAKGFALFGTAFPAWLSARLGGAANLLRLHAVWGLLWAAVIVPLFLVYKRGGREALVEVRLRASDLRWLLLKPLAMLGLARQPLPPQDKYNAGQKLFAISAILGTATIIATGLIMTFHLGSSAVVAAAILGHKLAIALALLGVAVHFTMAAVIAEERPALKSMLTGHVAATHAAEHSALWVEELRHEQDPAQRRSA